MRAESGQFAAGEAVAAGSVQNALTRLDIKKFSDNRPFENLEKIIAFIAHFSVPDGGVGFPGGVGFFMRGERGHVAPSRG
jgi:hypothetical protein